MVTKRTCYVVTAKPNVFGNRRQIKTFKNKCEAKAFVKKLNAPGKVRKLPGGKKIRLTSFRESQSGTGINNPRIKKTKSFI